MNLKSKLRNSSNQYFMPILFLLLLAISLWKSPLVMPLLCVFFVCFSLVISISSIIKKHKQSESPRIKIVKEILVLIFTLTLVVLLGRMTGMYANQYAAQRFGIIPGILSALVASFVIGYIVRWGIGKTISRNEKQFSPR